MSFLETKVSIAGESSPWEEQKSLKWSFIWYVRKILWKTNISYPLIRKRKLGALNTDMIMKKYRKNLKS